MPFALKRSASRLTCCLYSNSPVHQKISKYCTKQSHFTIGKERSNDQRAEQWQLWEQDADLQNKESHGQQWKPSLSLNPSLLFAQCQKWDWVVHIESGNGRKNILSSIYVQAALYRGSHSGHEYCVDVCATQRLPTAVLQWHFIRFWS